MGRFFISIVLVAALSACAATIARNPVPRTLVDAAIPPGFENVRSWGDQAPDNIDAIVSEKVAQMRATRPKLFRASNPRIDYLAISGGGSDGAFGAGLLAGWSRRGNRPEFDIVTGVSTGALSAPFAFLGREYDERLREIYTQYSTNQLLTVQLFAGIIGNAGAIADNSGLKKLIAQYFDASVLRAIARQHLRGRRLLIGTTNLDAQRPVIWDLGAVAVRGGARGLALAREILLASASLPGVFPPVLIDVEAGGSRFREMHVDGGPTAEVFFLPAGIELSKYAARFSGRPERRLFIIRNGKLTPEWDVVKYSTIDIARRSITTLTKSQGNGDLLRLFESSERNGIDYNLVAIPAEFTLKNKEAFDRDYMLALFELGYRLGAEGHAWKKRPPVN